MKFLKIMFFIFFLSNENILSMEENAERGDVKSDVKEKDPTEDITHELESGLSPEQLEEAKKETEQIANEQTENARPALTRSQRAKIYFCLCLFYLSPKKITKALLYRLFAACGSAASAYIITGSVGQSLQIAGLTSGVSTCLYYIWDRGWTKLCGPHTRGDRMLSHCCPCDGNAS